MGIYRQFTDSEGQSHNEELAPNSLEALTQWAPAKNWRLHIHPAGTFLDWHPASGVLIIVVLSGKIEIITSDGKGLVCCPGDMRITSDTGKGHIGRVVGDEPCKVLMVEIDG